MSRQTDYAGLVEVDKVVYNWSLYAKSERERLRRINYSRARRGSVLIACLSETTLRIPVQG